MFSLCLWFGGKLAAAGAALANRCKVINSHLITLAVKLIIKLLITYNNCQIFNVLKLRTKIVT